MAVEHINIMDTLIFRNACLFLLLFIQLGAFGTCEPEIPPPCDEAVIFDQSDNYRIHRLHLPGSDTDFEGCSTGHETYFYIPAQDVDGHVFYKASAGLRNAWSIGFQEGCSEETLECIQLGVDTTAIGEYPLPAGEDLTISLSNHANASKSLNIQLAFEPNDGSEI